MSETPRTALHDLEYFREHPRDYIRECLRLRDKDGREQPFHVNTTQEQVLQAIEEARAAGLPPRVIVLKSRQVGVSTLSEGLLTHGAHTSPNQGSLVVAHKADSAKALFRMTRHFIEKLPPALRPHKKLDNVKELEFDNGSRLQVEVAGEVRSYTAQRVHLSEFAFYELARETLVAILQTVPRSIQSLVVIESTANGVGNHFHKLWLRAQSKHLDKSVPEEERGWIPVFIPWFKHAEYAIARPWFLPSDTTIDERRLAKRHGLNMRQLAWRRWCIENNCDGDEEVFQVEYPSTWQEAFLLSGRPVFDAPSMAYYRSCVPPEVPEATLPPESEIDFDVTKRVNIIVPVYRGRLRIYEEPRERHRYIVGVDPSEGDRGSDLSPIEVMDEMSMNQVAEWVGRTPPDELAVHAFRVGRYYGAVQEANGQEGEALVINEANNHGIMFHSTMLNMGYQNIYYRQTTEESVAGEITLKPGFFTSKKNRHHIINLFRRYARTKVKSYKDQRKFLLRSPVLVGQMDTFVYDGDKAVHQAGEHDDCVIAWALCLYAHHGDGEHPLEPLPEDVLLSAAAHAMLLRERDPDAAEKYSFDITGMTCAELEQIDEDAFVRRERRRGLSGEMMF